MDFLRSKNLSFRPFLSTDITPRYLHWLNDPVINEFSLRRAHPYTDVEAKGYFATLSKDEKILAICTREGLHIGNIKYGPIDWLNRCCDVSILVGDQNYWNKGVGSESIYTVTKHLFETLQMNRVGADSFNPAFVKSVLNLGWKEEGRKRQRMQAGGKWHDYIFLSILKSEFSHIEKFEFSK